MGGMLHRISEHFLKLVDRRFFMLFGRFLIIEGGWLLY